MPSPTDVSQPDAAALPPHYRPRGGSDWAGIVPAQSRRRKVVKIKQLIVGRFPFSGLRIGLLASALTAMLALTATGPAGAAVTSTGSGMTVNVVSVQMVSKVLVNVNVVVTCTTDNFGGNKPGDVYFVIAGLTLTENVKGTIVSYSGNRGNNGDWPYVTCDGTPQAFTIQILPPQSGVPWYKPGPAYVSSGQAGVFDNYASCGTLPQFGNFPAPCDTASFSGGVQINGGTN
jgi:hypothetical protein